jgi:Leucine-rich repeat (LRR) protein
MAISIAILLYLFSWIESNTIAQASNLISQAGGKPIIEKRSTEESRLIGADFSYTSFDNNQLRSFTSQLPDITVLLLHDTNVTEEGLESILRCKQLVKLTANSGLTAHGARIIGHLKNLTDLSVKFSRLTHAGFQEIAKLSRLQSLDLDNSDCSDDDIAILMNLSSLKHVSLTEVAVGDRAFENIHNLSKLESLGLYGTLITDKTVQHVGKLPRIKRLFLGHTKITNDGLVHLRSMANLEELDLYGTMISDSGILKMTGMTSLQWLSLQSTCVTGSCFADVFFPLLTDLNLRATRANNQAMKHLARSLPKLESLDLVGSSVDNVGLVESNYPRSLRRIIISRETVDNEVMRHYKIVYPHIILERY